MSADSAPRWAVEMLDRQARELEALRAENRSLKELLDEEVLVTLRAVAEGWAESVLEERDRLVDGGDA